MRECAAVNMLAVNPCPLPVLQGSIDHDEDQNGETEILLTPDEIDGRISHSCQISSAAVTHNFNRHRKISRCQHCDSRFFLHGARCDKCGISCHEKCLGELKFRCSHNACASDEALTAHVIKCCVDELDENGLQVKGIYRLAGVKSKVESLHQQIKSKGRVDLGEHPPVDIAAVLKLHLRQLPDPLLPCDLYDDLLSVAKEDSDNPDNMVERLKALMAKLPADNLTTCAMLMHHLLRVSEESDHNEMTLYNLGTVFAPTLMRPSDGGTDVNAFMHIPLLRKVVEVLINNVTEIFGPEVELEEGGVMSTSGIDLSGDELDGHSPLEENDFSPVGAKWYIPPPANDIVDGLNCNHNSQPSSQVTGNGNIDASPSQATNEERTINNTSNSGVKKWKQIFHRKGSDSEGEGSWKGGPCDYV